MIDNSYTGKVQEVSLNWGVNNLYVNNLKIKIKYLTFNNGWRTTIEETRITPKKTTDLWQVTDKLYYIILYAPL
jgi:hypothetical protein